MIKLGGSVGDEPRKKTWDQMHTSQAELNPTGPNAPCVPPHLIGRETRWEARRQKIEFVFLATFCDCERTNFCRYPAFNEYRGSTDARASSSILANARAATRANSSIHFFGLTEKRRRLLSHNCMIEDMEGGSLVLQLSSSRWAATSTAERESLLLKLSAIGSDFP